MATLVPKPVARVGETAGVAEPTLAAFFAANEQRAYRFAMYDLRDREAALDAVQDSMLKLMEHYRDKPALEWPALFFTILRNRVNDMHRWRIFERLRFVFDDPADEQTAPQAPIADGPDARTTAARRRVVLDRALRTLPRQQRHVLLLREMQELSVKETARVLGCTIGTVKQHHFRALQALRRRLPASLQHEL